MTDSPRKFDRVVEILEANKRDPARLIPVLQQVQEFYRYLPEEVLTFIATSLAIPPAHVYGVATFYAHFALEPKGKHVVRVCDGTACHVRKSTEIIRVIQAELGLGPKKHTSDDGLFTFEAVACLGACGLAPVVMVNEDVYGAVTKEKMLEILAKYRALEVQA